MQSLMLGDDFTHILRVLNTNVDGRTKIMYALTSIRGIGRRFANLTCKKAEVDMRKRWVCAQIAVAGRYRRRHPGMRSRAAACPEANLNCSTALHQRYREVLAGRRLRNRHILGCHKRRAAHQLTLPPWPCPPLWPAAPASCLRRSWSS